MSYIGNRGNSITAFRGSEQNAIINKNMYHLRDNSGDRSFDRIDLTKQNKVNASRKREHPTADHIIMMRFPNLAKYNENEQKIDEAKEANESEHKDSIRLHKTEKWVDHEAVDKEEAKANQNNNSESGEEGKKVIRYRSHTSAKKKFDTERLVKPTFSSMKRGRVLPRDPITKATVSTLKATKVFSPANPGQARKMLERNTFLNNNDNSDLDKANSSHHSNMFGGSGMNKTGIAKFVPNNKNPSHIKNASGFINSHNGFETFLRKKDEIPRLSILENYKQISRIMRNSFLKAKDIEQRFKNNALSSDELKKKKEEEENTKKLTKILKQMNSPRNAFATQDHSQML